MIMEFVSTRNHKLKTTAAKAIIEGLAQDGGLYVPTSLPLLAINELVGLDYHDLALAILSSLFDDFNKEELSVALDKAYGLFDTKEVVPLSTIGDRYLLELYHGPTSAFKDVALTLLPHLLKMAYKQSGCDKKIYILTATSGDTGKAALEGFKDVENTYITVFYPHEGVSEIQYRQMATTAGNNTQVIAARGNFDDCQRLVKKAYNHETFRKYDKVQLSSANSINIGRLFPQIVYYFSSYLQLVKDGRIKMGTKVSFVVPTGNFGNILAGYLAKKMGLPVLHLICASNDNDVLTEFLDTGVYNACRPFYLTTSPSMDILISSNLERLLYFASGDSEMVKGLMDDLSQNGRYQISEELLKKIQSEFRGYCIKQDEVARLIKEAFENDGRLIDPHTAVAYGAAKKYEEEVPVIILSTASPYKFANNVYACIKERAADEYEAMELLAKTSGMPIPKNLSSLKEMPIRHQEVIDIEDGLKTIERKLQELSHD